MRRNTGAGGSTVDPTTGVVHDYMNAWGFKITAFDLFTLLQGKQREEYEELINKPIQHYEEYVRETMPQWADEILAASNHDVVRKIDALVDLHNRKVKAGELTEKEFRKLFAAVDLLVRGKR